MHLGITTKVGKSCCLFDVRLRGLGCRLRGMQIHTSLRRGSPHKPALNVHCLLGGCSVPTQREGTKSFLIVQGSKSSKGPTWKSFPQGKFLPQVVEGLTAFTSFLFPGVEEGGNPT